MGMETVFASAFHGVDPQFAYTSGRLVITVPCLLLAAEKLREKLDLQAVQSLGKGIPASLVGHGEVEDKTRKPVRNLRGRQPGRWE